MTSSSPVTPVPPTRPSFFRSISSSSSVQNFSHELFPRKGKPRLYLALYTRGGSYLTPSYSTSVTCDSYHWTFLIGPESPARGEAGVCYQITHAASSLGPNPAAQSAFYEETNLSEQSQAQSQALLARIALAKVIDEDRLRNLLRAVPTSDISSNARGPRQKEHFDSEYDTDEVHPSSTCLTWVKEAYKVLTTDTKCLRGYICAEDWPDVEEVARMYVKRKRRQGRFGDQGRTEGFRTWNPEEIPTWNFWENRETTD